MQIDPRLIIEFAIIAEERSFTKASMRLRVAQPWLTTRLKKLEDLVGFRLLDRNTRSVVLTDAGAEFFAVAKAVADATEAANTTGQQLRRKDGKMVRVGVAPYTKTIRERRALIDRFAARRPDFALELEMGWTLRLLERLRDGQIDLSFLMGCHDADVFESIELRRFRAGLTVSPHHALAGRSIINPRELQGLPVRCYTRSLNPALFDLLYAPLIAAGAIIVEDPEMAEGPPDIMSSETDIACFFDFGSDAPANPGHVHIPLEAPSNVPFSLVRRRHTQLPAGQIFWAIAGQT